MSDINNLGALIGVIIGAAFLLVGGVLLPIWHMTEDRRTTKRTPA
jgi:hypothetical protein